MRSQGDDLKLAILGMTGRPRSARELDATVPDVPSGLDTCDAVPLAGLERSIGRDDGSISGSNGNALSSRPLHCLAITGRGEPDGREADYGTHRVLVLTQSTDLPIYRDFELRSGHLPFSVSRTGRCGGKGERARSSVGWRDVKEREGED